MPNMLIKMIWTRNHLKIFFSDINVPVETKDDRTFHYGVHVVYRILIFSGGRKFNMTAVASKVF